MAMGLFCRGRRPHGLGRRFTGYRACVGGRLSAARDGHELKRPELDDHRPRFALLIRRASVSWLMCAWRAM